ncbi:hypothetical protein L3X38_032246 [Prunus dulcis]|uniref:Uncharacterized protein n=1 Tax=Prunus dulcis TaxID=3755 RepID=A0AAD4VDN1_PRUDU|nr:hypothetical protein L3X38_032246 [Prunus dulcis]
MPTGEDRFYIPVKARKRYNNQQKQARKAKNDANENPKELPKSKVVVSEKRSPKEPPNTLAKPSSESSLKPSSNVLSVVLCIWLLQNCLKMGRKLSFCCWVFHMWENNRGCTCQALNK